VTKNLCLNNLRDLRRRGQLLAGRAAQTGGDGATHARLLVGELLARVPADLQEIAAHYYLDDLSHEDIAALRVLPPTSELAPPLPRLDR